MKTSGICAAAAFAFCGIAHADCFWSRIDREVSFSDTGAWKPSTYRTVANTLTAANLLGALWEGTESRAGRTMWQAAEAQVLAEAVALAAKPAFGRLRPAEAHDPCKWRQGGRSFFSEEATLSAALVTPWVREYAGSNPVAYGLLLLPAYVGAGRVKNHAHWQTDVLAGWAVGGAVGWWEHSHKQPLVLSVVPGGAFVGIRRSF